MDIAKKKILFIDRDGTLIDEPKTNFQIDSFEKLKFERGVISALKDIVDHTDYRLVMISNQDGLGTDSFPIDSFKGPQNLMLQTFLSEGVLFDKVLIDSSFPTDNSPMRKPEIGLVKHYLNELLDLDNSYVIGDRMTDMELAKNMGIKGVLYGGETSDTVEGLPIALKTNNWLAIAEFIKKNSRQVYCTRRTNETDIQLTLNLNGRGEAQIETGIAFFDHMLEQIARHSELDLILKAVGDLDVDEHHTIEDTGLLLGEAFKETLGTKKGIERYGFSLPMDESDATVLLDFGGRPYLVWSVDLIKPYVGDFPTDMTKHFFESFCQTAKCNLNISAKGENTHHIIEAIFKAFARCIKQAIKQSGNLLPTSKGVL